MTIKEIASLGRVSLSQRFPKIVNIQRPRLSILRTRSRVLKIVNEFNYTPYRHGKKYIQCKCPFAVGVLLRHRLTDQSDAETASCRQLRSSGYNVLLLDCLNSTDTELKRSISSAVQETMWTV